MIAHARRSAASCAFFFALLAACNGANEAPDMAVVRDSAGIAIVENPSPDAARRYSVSGPVLEIGTVSGAEEYALHDITAVVRLSDGSVAVAIGSSEIRWFDAEGGFLRRVGRAGGGPGEFRNIRYMRALEGDSLLVFDSGNRRVSVLGPDGSFVRGERIWLDDERPLTVSGALRDGTLLTRAVLETPHTSTPLYRPRLEFSVSAAGTTSTLRRYLGPEAALHASGSDGDIGSVFISVLPFARTVHAASGPAHFFVGSSDSYQIDVWERSGRLARIIRVAVPVKPVTEQVRDSYIAQELIQRRQRAESRGRPFEEATARRQLRDQHYAPSIPAYAALLASADGGLWAKDFAMPHALPTPEHWTIFDPDGRLTGVVELPQGFTPLYVERSLVLGVIRDSLDVPFVHRYTVR